MIYGLILAGGKGSRLYPLSRANQPKQFLKLINDKSFLVNTVDRIIPIIDRDNIYVVTNMDYREKVENELNRILSLPEINNWNSGSFNHYKLESYIELDLIIEKK